MIFKQSVPTTYEVQQKLHIIEKESLIRSYPEEKNSHVIEIELDLEK